MIPRFVTVRAHTRATDQATETVAVGAIGFATSLSTAAIIVLLGGTMAIVVHSGTALLLRSGLHQVQGVLDVVGDLELQALLWSNARWIRGANKQMPFSRRREGDALIAMGRLLAEETTLGWASSRRR